MIKSILFLLSLFLVITNFLLIKKSDKSLSIIKWFFITIVVFFCLNAIIVYFLSYMYIKSNLITISLIYIIIGIFIYYKFLKKEKQKYYFNSKELIHLLIIFLVVVIVSIVRFGFPFSITYQTLDPAVHLQSTYSFYRESLLLNFSSSNTILNFETWRFASYTNLGIIFKFFSPFVNEFFFYNIYIIYDILTLFITCVMFYYLIKADKTNSIIKLIISIFFLLGYPLNNLLIGFFYVGHASVIIICLMIIIQDIKNDKILFSFISIMNIGLLFTYYLFAPFIFIAEFVYYIKSKHIIKKYFFIFVIPLIMWLTYFILPTLSNQDMNLISQTKIDGFFYNDIIGNTLLFIPIIIYYFACQLKKHKVDFEMLVFIFLVGIIILLNIFAIFGLLMPYYISKYYYILWILCFIILVKTYDNYYINNKLIFKSYGIFMILTIIITVSNIENTIIDLNEGDWNKTTPTMLFNVYRYNINLFEKPVVIFTADELEDIRNLDQIKVGNFLTNTEPERIIWLFNFIDLDKVNCPVNQLYDCVNDLYNVNINDYLYYCDTQECHDKYYIFFFRSIYWVNMDNYFDSINSSYIKDKYKFGYIMKK